LRVKDATNKIQIKFNSYLPESNVSVETGASGFAASQNIYSRWWVLLKPTVR